MDSNTGFCHIIIQHVPRHPVHCTHSITVMLYSLPTLISLPVSPCPSPGLPCNCPDRFVPVCASNGRTYPSACVARCMGFKDHQFVFGQCRLSNPCTYKPCQRNQRWVQLHSLLSTDSWRTIKRNKPFQYIFSSELNILIEIFKHHWQFLFCSVLYFLQCRKSQTLK